MIVEQLSLFEASYEKPELPSHIRLIEFFAGIGAQAKALEILGADFETWRTCEWSWQSITAYNAIHMGGRVEDISSLTYEEVLEKINGVSNDYNKPMTEKQLRKKGEKWARELLGKMIANKNFCPDVSKLHGKDLDIREKEKNTYILTYSFPCFTGDQMVLTKEYGYVRFEHLRAGLNVLSKDGKWHKISKFFNNGVRKTAIVKAQGFSSIHTTPDHKFWAREKKFKGHERTRVFLEAKWVHAKDLTRNHYLGVPVIQDEVPFHTQSLEFWELIGFYIGDGWINNKDIRISCNERKLTRVKDLATALAIQFTINQTSEHCWNIRFRNDGIYGFIRDFIGTGSDKKKIPMEILSLPKEQLLALFNGVISSDGCKVGKNYQFSTINENIAYSVSLIVNKLFHRVCNVYEIKTKPLCVIQGRTVRQKPWYQLRFKLENGKQDKAFYEDGYIWYPFSSYEEADEEYVYDIEVEEDHSFTLKGCIVSNCQDLSNAGKLAGMEKGSGTRSGLLWEVERILLECLQLNQLPQVLVMENVPLVCSSKNLKPWNDWLNALEKMGYTNYHKIMNAKDYGIPQNRNRCFMVSVLGEYSYTFPKKQHLKYVLKDYLESGVDDWYYLSDDLVRGFEEYTERQREAGNGFGFEPTDGEAPAKSIVTRAGAHGCDNFLKDWNDDENPI